MGSIKRKKCRNRKCFFIPDHRNRNRQRYCARPECRKASKAASQEKWLSKPENQDYFRMPENVQRVRQWGEDNPRVLEMGKKADCVTKSLKRSRC